MLKFDAIGGGHACDRSDLVENQMLGIVGRYVHVPTAEADEVREAGVSANRDPVGIGEAESAAKHRGIAGVKPCGDRCRRDRSHQSPIVADRKRAEGFADVSVEVDSHKPAPTQLD